MSNYFINARVRIWRPLVVSLSTELDDGARASLAMAPGPGGQGATGMYTGAGAAGAAPESWPQLSAAAAGGPGSGGPVSARGSGPAGTGPADGGPKRRRASGKRKPKIKTPPVLPGPPSGT